MSESKATTDFDDEDEYLYGTEEPSALPQQDTKEEIVIEKETDDDIYGSEFKDENNLNQIDQAEDIILPGDKLPSGEEKLPQVELTDEIMSGSPAEIEAGPQIEVLPEPSVVKKASA